MKPRFANPLSWQQAELLMQPSFIRVIDNLRKQLEQSSWKGTYQELQIWPEGTPDNMKTQVLALKQQLEAAPANAADLEQELALLPQPYPGYVLCLEQGDRQVQVDLWQLCYQICFDNYDVAAAAAIADAHDPIVEIDTRLIDGAGDVDWQQLDDKARGLIEGIFHNLPQGEPS